MKESLQIHLQLARVGPRVQASQAQKVCAPTTSSSSLVNKFLLLRVSCRKRWSMMNFRLSVRIYQPSNLPEFCPHRCWALSQDPLVSEYPGTSRFQKSPPTDSVVRLWMLFDDAFVGICPLYEKKRLLVSIVGYMLINWLTSDKSSSLLNFYNLHDYATKWHKPTDR